MGLVIEHSKICCTAILGIITFLFNYQILASLFGSFSICLFLLLFACSCRATPFANSFPSTPEGALTLTIAKVFRVWMRCKMAKMKRPCSISFSLLIKNPPLTIVLGYSPSISWICPKYLLISSLCMVRLGARLPVLLLGLSWVGGQCCIRFYNWKFCGDCIACLAFFSLWDETSTFTLKFNICINIRIRFLIPPQFCCCYCKE